MSQGELRLERAAQEVVKRQLDLLEARLTEIVAGYACPSCRHVLPLLLLQFSRPTPAMIACTACMACCNL
jgi:hypothetical protein